MVEVNSMTKPQLEALQAELEMKYEEALHKNLKLDMSRGKPGADQLDVCNPMLDMQLDYHTESGLDARNYGVLDGLPECKKLFGELLDIEPEQMIIGGNSSLNLMYDTIAKLWIFGKGGNPAWSTYKNRGESIKFLCPSPGYDRHFAICEAFGIEMIPIPLLEDGPDMEMVSRLAKSEEGVKGIWCVPLHSNPQGICYSDQVVEKIANLETAASDFCIFWDNAYAVHHIYQEAAQRCVLRAAESEEKRDRIYYFFSTSKISFPGAGVSMVATGKNNAGELKKHMSVQTIGYDKLNQLRHVQYFQSGEHLKNHMRILAGKLRPKFDMVLEKLEESLGGTNLAVWSKPKGGYFISVDTLPGCAKETVALAQKAGVKLTDAGATYPYGRDEKDTNIRIAPSYPTLEELEQAMDLFCLCVKLAGVKVLLQR